MEFLERGEDASRHSGDFSISKGLRLRIVRRVEGLKVSPFLREEKLSLGLEEGGVVARARVNVLRDFFEFFPCARHDLRAVFVRDALMSNCTFFE